MKDQESVHIGTNSDNNHPQSFKPIQITSDIEMQVATDSDTANPSLADFFIGYGMPLL